MKNKVIFFVETEYHLMVSISIALDFYLNDEVIIYYLSTNNRLNGNYSFDKLNFSFKQLKLHQLNYKHLFNELYLLNPNRFFFFQENNEFLIYLSKMLKKKMNCIISLGQDGAKPYSFFNKKFIKLTSIKDTLLAYKQLIKNKIFPKNLFVIDKYRYGSTKHIDELWLSNPNSYKNIFKKKIIKIPDFNQINIIDNLRFFFGVKDLIMQKNIIFYINQPFYDKDFFTKELVLLKEIKKKFINKNIVIKIHPLTNNNIIQGYIRELNAHIIKDSTVPAELFIQNLSESIIISGWSTALLSNNPKCKFYYIYPLLFENSKSIINPSNPTEHITVIESLEQI